MKQTTLFSLISLLFGTLLGILTGEVVSRIYFFGADAFSYKKVNSFIPIGLSGFLTGSENYKTLYELKPHIDDYFKLATFKTNSQGCRDREYSIKKPGNTVRGIVIGDSFTMGSGVEIEDVYHSVVEKKLNEQSNSVQYELINFGVGGYNLLNYQGVLANKILPYTPDFIIISFTGDNDFFMPGERHYKGNYNAKIRKKGKAVFFSCFLKKLILMTFSTKPLKPKTAIKIKEEEHAFVDRMFQSFRQYSQDRDIPVFINYLSLLEDNGNLEVIKSIAKKHGLPFTDSYHKFDYQHICQYHINKLDRHPNKKANAIFAETLLEFEPFVNKLNKK